MEQPIRSFVSQLGRGLPGILSACRWKGGTFHSSNGISRKKSHRIPVTKLQVHFRIMFSFYNWRCIKIRDGLILLIFFTNGEKVRRNSLVGNTKCSAKISIFCVFSQNSDSRYSKSWFQFQSTAHVHAVQESFTSTKNGTTNKHSKRRRYRTTRNMEVSDIFTGDSGSFVLGK